MNSLLPPDVLQQVLLRMQSMEGQVAQQADALHQAEMNNQGLGTLLSNQATLPAVQFHTPSTQGSQSRVANGFQLLPTGNAAYAAQPNAAALLSQAENIALSTPAQLPALTGQVHAPTHEYSAKVMKNFGPAGPI